MGKNLLPKFLTDNYEIFEWNHAISILHCDFNNEFNEIIDILSDFRLTKTNILENGGKKSPIANSIDSKFYQKKWEEKKFEIKISIDGEKIHIPTHKVDCYKNRIALEMEWNNKDPFFDRDLNNFRLLFDLNAISVGIIITRCSELQKLFNKLGKGKSYGNSTTHMNKLIPKIQANGAGGCPILIFGISDNLYLDI